MVDSIASRATPERVRLVAPSRAIVEHHMSDGLSSIHALLVEDDARLAGLTAKYLEGYGVVVTIVDNGLEAVQVAGSTAFDVVLLDVMLPGQDGLAVCRELRHRSDVPIIMVTARGDEVDRIVGLEGGADDYLPKPFSPRELLARIRSQVRRSRGQVGPRVERALSVGGLVLDPPTLTVTLDGAPISLTAYEFSLLYALAEHPGRVLSREMLLERAKGSAEEAFDRSIDVRISRLRAKLGDDSKHPRLLKTVRGAGYVLAIDGSAP